MKKLKAIVLSAIWVLGIVGCSNDNIDITVPVFETDNISSITFFTPSNYEQGIEVPDEHMDEIVAWLASFRIDKKAGETLKPGTNSISFQIVYLDGRIVESGVSTTIVDGDVYYMRAENTPPCYTEMVFGR